MRPVGLGLGQEGGEHGENEGGRVLAVEDRAGAGREAEFATELLQRRPPAKSGKTAERKDDAVRPRTEVAERIEIRRGSEDAGVAGRKE